MSETKKSSEKTVLNAEVLSIGYCTAQGTRYIAKNLNLCLKKGQLVCLLGKNGVGKSTLLRTLTKTQHKLSGRIAIEGRELSDLDGAALARKMSLVLTEKTPENQFTVAEMIALGRQPHTNWTGKLGPKDREKVALALKQTKLEKLAQHPYQTLSDGQLQKAMIARALAQDTDLIVLDEPTAHLDLHQRIEIFQLLKKLVVKSGKTILLSTHEVNLALSVADELWLMTTDKLMCGQTEDLIRSRDIQKLFPDKQLIFDSNLRQFIYRNHPSASKSSNKLKK